jgi:hypothetical protein
VGFDQPNSWSGHVFEGDKCQIEAGKEDVYRDETQMEAEKRKKRKKEGIEYEGTIT